ncbi:RDD family protein [Nocardia wallacei]|uniref:RDD family protein n=1 Tax=Nocardia wallacei TaxID=480035 RepID=UPI0024557064|nr:RDD family protein [Nocardia wallacei]
MTAHEAGSGAAAGLRYAPWHLRLVSGLVDGLLVGAVFGVWMVVLRTSPEWIGPQPEDLSSGDIGYAEGLEGRRQTTRWLVGAMLSVTALVLLANTVVAQGITGRTLGKLLTGQRLVRSAPGRRVGIGRALLRQCAHVLDAVPCYLGFLWPLFDAQRRTFADIVTKTVVVQGESATREIGAPRTVSTPPIPARRNYLLVACVMIAVLIAGSAVLIGIVAARSTHDPVAEPVRDDVPAPPGKVALAPVRSMVLAPDGRYAYVSERNVDRVSTVATVQVIDTSTTVVATRIAVGAGELAALAISPDGRRLYGAVDTALVVIDTASRQVVDTVDFGHDVDRLEISGDGRRIYAGGGREATVSVYDTVTRQRIATAVLAPGVEFERITEMTLTADDRRLYVGMYEFDAELTPAIAILDAAGLAEVGRSRPGGPEIALVGTPDNRYLYEAWPRGAGGLSEIRRLDTATGADTVLIQVSSAHDLVLSPNGRFLFIAHEPLRGTDPTPGFVTVLDTRSGTTVGQLAFDFAPGQSAVSPDGTRLYVVSGAAGLSTQPGWFASADISEYR